MAPVPGAETVRLKFCSEDEDAPPDSYLAQKVCEPIADPKVRLEIEFEQELSE